jgi:protein-S-isoprenylcysteine O-methyltransferase Ste14
MRAEGGTLFRWRSMALLVFLPLVALAVRQAEPVERQLGEFWGETFEIACIGLVVAGLALRAFTVGFVPARTSGRNTRGQVASVLNTSGVYSLTRNPLYLANCLTYVGIMLYTQDLMLALAFALFLMIYYERIILAEEAFLVGLFGDEYRTWAADVPAFLPRLTGWRRPALPFSLRSVLRREYPGWLAAALALAAIDLAADYFGAEAESLIDDDWLSTSAVAGAMFLIVHTLRRAGVLEVPGR